MDNRRHPFVYRVLAERKRIDTRRSVAEADIAAAESDMAAARQRHADALRELEEANTQESSLNQEAAARVREAETNARNSIAQFHELRAALGNTRQQTSHSAAEPIAVDNHDVPRAQRDTAAVDESSRVVAGNNRPERHRRSPTPQDDSATDPVNSFAAPIAAAERSGLKRPRNNSAHGGTRLAAQGPYRCDVCESTVGSLNAKFSHRRRCKGKCTRCAAENLPCQKTSGRCQPCVDANVDGCSCFPEFSRARQGSLPAGSNMHRNSMPNIGMSRSTAANDFAPVESNRQAFVGNPLATFTTNPMVNTPAANRMISYHTPPYTEPGNPVADTTASRISETYDPAQRAPRTYEESVIGANFNYLTGKSRLFNDRAVIATAINSSATNTSIRHNPVRNPASRSVATRVTRARSAMTLSNIVDTPATSIAATPVPTANITTPAAPTRDEATIEAAIILTNMANTPAPPLTNNPGPSLFDSSTQRDKHTCDKCGVGIFCGGPNSTEMANHVAECRGKCEMCREFDIACETVDIDGACLACLEVDVRPCTFLWERDFGSGSGSGVNARREVRDSVDVKMGGLDGGEEGQE